LSYRTRRNGSPRQRGRVFRVRGRDWEEFTNQPRIGVVWEAPEQVDEGVFVGTVAVERKHHLTTLLGKIEAFLRLNLELSEQTKRNILTLIERDQNKKNPDLSSERADELRAALQFRKEDVQGVLSRWEVEDEQYGRLHPKSDVYSERELGEYVDSTGKVKYDSMAGEIKLLEKNAETGAEEEITIDIPTGQRVEVATEFFGLGKQRERADLTGEEQVGAFTYRTFGGDVQIDEASMHSGVLSKGGTTSAVVQRINQRIKKAREAAGLDTRFRRKLSSEEKKGMAVDRDAFEGSLPIRDIRPEHYGQVTTRGTLKKWVQRNAPSKNKPRNMWTRNEAIAVEARNRLRIENFAHQMYGAGFPLRVSQGGKSPAFREFRGLKNDNVFGVITQVKRVRPITRTKAAPIFTTTPETDPQSRTIQEREYLRGIEQDLSRLKRKVTKE